jgi:phosphoribosylformylglycinamidine synthase
VRVWLDLSPTEEELEALAQIWSEHRRHKIFNSLIHYREGGEEDIVDSLFRTYILETIENVAERVERLLSIFHDNAGAIRFNTGYGLVMKAETHISPLALDPYNGALTKVVGINGDPMGLGWGSGSSSTPTFSAPRC